MQFKSFDRALFEANDARARKAIKDYLGPECVDNEDIYGPDLIYKGKFIEVEVCKRWTDKFPYQTASVPGRKGKWKHLDIEYWMLSNDLSKVMITPGKQLLDKFLIEVPNRYVSSGEYFYRVPLENVTEIVITKDTSDEE